MNKEIETKLIECHILMVEALKDMKIELIRVTSCLN